MSARLAVVSRIWLTRTLTALTLTALVFCSSCAQLNQLLGGVGGGGVARALNPTVTASPVQLTRYPSMQLLGAYYCPLVITDAAARLGCGLVLGQQPPRERLVFEFGTNITVQNPNNIPIPALDILVAL